MVTARRRKPKELGLWMNGSFVGTWALTAQGDSLQYDARWAASASGRPLSLSLPFRPGNPPHRGDLVRHYFENLLPDSKAIRERLARRYQAADNDAFALLAEAGRDCVGALQILPLGTTPELSWSIDARPLSEREVAELLHQTLEPTPLALIEGEELRLSIAGAQEKTALLRHLDQWCWPHGATPTTHILKLPMGLVGGLQLDLRHSVENEWLCSRILAAYGMPVAACDILCFEDQKVLAVERFDRRWSRDPASGQATLLRLPQEDMCQATGISPWLKYEADGGPGMKEIMALLGGAIDPVAARRHFFKAQLLFWMLWATDGHAKNFSLFLKAGGRYEPTPLYDVLSVFPLIGEGPGKLSSHRAAMAMAVRGKNAHRKMKEILPRHWMALGIHFGIVAENGDGPRAILQELAEQTDQVIAKVQADLPPGFPSELAASILDGLRRSASSLLSFVQTA
ncbi:HipA domain-containing protein [Herbaspirillum rubrisubalbicans M1]|uniref:type II toxin-antitoxin system HipA family toxin n=1 Tax=Herbaspirillum rubrisubalbicans TaxID=80842 RepID=UPI00073AB3A8|nr:type II toxin-antitoxin system HipA family toxin [Herbaspirillum rubrisubalbicans]ALU87620.1 HipA domain-containing protein [Herbaspirillum rubrisubalbicans M1]